MGGSVRPSPDYKTLVSNVDGFGCPLHVVMRRVLMGIPKYILLLPKFLILMCKVETGDIVNAQESQVIPQVGRYGLLRVAL